jgi:hypothetical protein
MLFPDLISFIEETRCGQPVQGLTDNEMQEIQIDQGLEALPACYREFLRRMGRCAGQLLIGTDAFHPALLGIRADALELLRENGVSHLIGGDAVVIGMHQGYQAYWLETASEDDPAVYLYQEGDTGTRKRWTSFSAFLLDQFKQEHPRWVARGNLTSKTMPVTKAGGRVGLSSYG